MSFALLESGALIVAVLTALEMRRQQLPWRSVVIRSLIVLAILTVAIAWWRGQ
jgi:hypothetical protein